MFQQTLLYFSFYAKISIRINKGKLYVNQAKIY